MDSKHSSSGSTSAGFNFNYDHNGVPYSTGSAPGDAQAFGGFQGSRSAPKRIYGGLRSRSLSSHGNSGLQNINEYNSAGSTPYSDQSNSYVYSLRERTAELSHMALEEGMSAVGSRSDSQLKNRVPIHELPEEADSHETGHGDSFGDGTNDNATVDPEAYDSFDVLASENVPILGLGSRGASRAGSTAGTSSYPGTGMGQFSPSDNAAIGTAIGTASGTASGSYSDDHIYTGDTSVDKSRTANSSYSYQTFANHQNIEDRFDDEQHLTVASARWRIGNLIKSKCSKESIIDNAIREPLRLLPSVFLGLLMNVLDGLSYGMILFPLGTQIFSHLGPSGLSMFYVSTIISQLVYSLGASAFKSGIGSEMIEVVPFFHSMAFSIMANVGEDDPAAVISTTIVSYAISSVVTGLVFFLLGYGNLGALVGFFPRHILIGCIGGVGWFLVVTGIEVSSRLESSLEYTIPVFKHLFLNLDVLIKWTTPIALALVLMGLQRRIHHALLVPGYFIFLFFLFHFIVYIIPGVDLDLVRQHGWIFPKTESNEPWWYFYTLYDFKKVNVSALLDTVPAMFALTFFGLLHVPINVPALAVSIGEDNVDVNRELIAHGISNALSGLCGSIQNYLVYTNSILFIKSGADSRLAGVMLAIATACIMMTGPVVIGYIPVMVVAALIFLLGFELLIESLVDTWGRLSRFEYITLAVIVVTMGMWDFVYGIITGIVLACVSFVIQASQTSIVKATYTGDTARSTVRRHSSQQRFLEQVGRQIYIIKLSGYVFFGTIVSLEKRIKMLMDDALFDDKPIKYLVLDISGVTDIDFSAAEAFARMKRLMDSRKVTLALAGATVSSKAVQGLKAVQLLDNESSTLEDKDSVAVRLFPDLNTALEFCENAFLTTYYRQRDALMRVHLAQNPAASGATSNQHIPQKKRLQSQLGSMGSIYGASPRANIINLASTETAKSDIQSVTKWQHFKPPLPIMMQIFQDVSNKNEDFWFEVVPYFKKLQLEAGHILYQRDHEATGFYLVESGMLRADYELAQGRLYESILAGTTCGELPFFSRTTRTATVAAEINSVVWMLDRENWEVLKQEKPQIAMELLEIALKLTVERFTSITAYIMMLSSS